MSCYLAQEREAERGRKKGKEGRGEERRGEEAMGRWSGDGRVDSGDI